MPPGGVIQASALLALHRIPWWRSPSRGGIWRCPSPFFFCLLRSFFGLFWSGFSVFSGVVQDFAFVFVGGS